MSVSTVAVALYSVFTFAFTEWRTKFRVTMNLFLFSWEVFVFVDAEIKVDAFGCVQSLNNSFVSVSRVLCQYQFP